MVEKRERSAYNQSWQLGFQRQIGTAWLAEVDYVGTRGVKLPNSFHLNHVRSIWHFLQAKLEHRWKSGLLIQTAYTWSS